LVTIKVISRRLSLALLLCHILAFGGPGDATCGQSARRLISKWIEVLAKSIQTILARVARHLRISAFSAQLSSLPIRKEVGARRGEGAVHAWQVDAAGITLAVNIMVAIVAVIFTANAPT